MRPRLAGLIKPFFAVSIIGMVKNAGKTTVLNYLMEELRKEGVRLALTSIGRDGESIDVVTNTEKPLIYVPMGTLIATARDLLKHCDISKEVLETTGINTPLGEVIITRALSDGFVQLGGASTNNGILLLREIFRANGAEKILVDGAVSRRALSSPAVTNAAILCTGASLNADIEKVVTETAFIVKTFTLEKANENLIEAAAKIPQTLRLALVDDDYGFTPFDFTGKIPPFKYILTRGAVSDSHISKLFASNINLKNAEIIIEDSTKLFIKPETFYRLLRKECRLTVLNQINLVALTINPYSVYSGSFDSGEFFNRMSENVSLPVFNVKDHGV